MTVCYSPLFISSPRSPLTRPPAHRWSHEELCHLLGTNLGIGVRHRRRTLRATYTALVPPLCAFAPDVFAPAVFTWDAYLWAHSTYTSRGFVGHLGRTEASAQRPLVDNFVAPAPSVARHLASQDVGGSTAASALAGGNQSEDGIAGTSNQHDGSGSHNGNIGNDGDDDDDEQVAAQQLCGCLIPLEDIFNHRHRKRVTWRGGADAVAFVTDDEIALVRCAWGWRVFCLR
jgi:hypothetical protein